MPDQKPSVQPAPAPCCGQGPDETAVEYTRRLRGLCERLTAELAQQHAERECAVEACHLVADAYGNDVFARDEATTPKACAVLAACLVAQTCALAAVREP